MTKIIVSLKDAENGKAFTSIDVNTLSKFKESDYTKIKDEGREKLVNDLRTVAIPALPEECFIESSYFGILATDLFSLNTLLGSMIENRVVFFLNSHRNLWDADENWNDFHFIRSNESFPDVRLVKKSNSQEVKLGIELKSWFILSKEGEPSFRYCTAANACDPADLLCIVPWYLSDAVCGHPVLVSPWIFSARAASEATKRYWLYERETKTAMTLEQRALNEPQNLSPYMLNARDNTNYTPISDSGNNFGRLARTGVMSKFVEETLQTDILGIPADNWRRFLQAHTDASAINDVRKKIDKIVQISKSEEFEQLKKSLRDYLDLLPKV